MPSLRGQYIYKLFGIFCTEDLFLIFWLVLILYFGGYGKQYYGYRSQLTLSCRLPFMRSLQYWSPDSCLAQCFSKFDSWARNISIIWDVTEILKPHPRLNWIRNFSKSSWCMVKFKNHWFSQIVRKTCTCSFCQASNWSWGLHYLPEPIEESGLGWEWCGVRVYAN